MPIGERITPEMTARYRAEGLWPSVRYVDLLDQVAGATPDKEALVDSRKRLTFAQFALGTKRLALAFHELGLRKGDMVTTQLANSCDYMLVQYAFRRLGVICLFVTMDQRAHELRYALDRIDAVAVCIEANNPRFDYVKLYRNEILPSCPKVTLAFAAGEKRVPDMIAVDDLLADPIEMRYPAGYVDTLKPDLDDPIALTSTSGTTAQPKFLLLKEGTALGKCFVERLRLASDDVALVAAPLRGGASNAYKYGFPYVGMKGVFQERFDAEEALRLVERERVTIICAVPAQFVKMLDCPNFDRYDLSSVRLAFYVGDLLPKHVAEQVHRRMNAEVTDDYGAMDVGVMCISTLDDPPAVRHSSVGRPIPGVYVRAVDDEHRDVPPGVPGELWFSGPNAGRIGGYYKDPELTRKAWTADDWYMSGDLGIINPDGTVSIVGRKRDMIIRGGQNISPKEIENLALGHPSVHDVAVVGMPDRVMGEKACVFVIPRTGETLTLEELIAFLRQHEIAAYKLPERLELVDSFPMSADGQKVQKHLLRQAIEQKLMQEATT